MGGGLHYDNVMAMPPGMRNQVVAQVLAKVSARAEEDAYNPSGIAITEERKYVVKSTDKKERSLHMKQYIGTKILEAEPAVRFRGTVYGLADTVPLHLMEEYPEEVQRGYRLRYPDGYISWSPENVFQEAYRRTDGMNFGLAIEAAKKGKKIARQGWNGKNQYVELADCISYKNNAGEIVNVDHCNIGNKALAFVGTSGVQMGWLASQADMLADDWHIVE